MKILTPLRRRSDSSRAKLHHPRTELHRELQASRRYALGAKVTLRSSMMWEFLDRPISVATPRIRDFAD